LTYRTPGGTLCPRCGPVGEIICGYCKRLGPSSTTRPLAVGQAHENLVIAEVVKVIEMISRIMSKMRRGQGRKTSRTSAATS